MRERARPRRRARGRPLARRVHGARRAGALSLADAVRPCARAARSCRRRCPRAGRDGRDPRARRRDGRGPCREASRRGRGGVAGELQRAGQMVIAGHAGAVERAMALREAEGRQAGQPLPVSAPFHCALMAPAARGCARSWSGSRWRRSRFPVVANVDAAEHGPGAREGASCRQVTAGALGGVGADAGRDGCRRGVRGRAGQGARRAWSSAARRRQAGGAQWLIRRVALVTGGSRGIGRACAMALRAEGARGRELRGERGRPRPRRCRRSRSRRQGRAQSRFDVADAAAIDAAIEQIVKEHGRLDVLVNNAGIAIDGLLLRIKEEDWQRTIDVNLSGAFHCCKAASRYHDRRPRRAHREHLVGRRRDRATPGRSPTRPRRPGSSASPSRRARSSRRATSGQLRRARLHRDRHDRGARAGRDREALLKMIPLGRIGTAEEIADAVRFLASRVPATSPAKSSASTAGF